MRQTYNVTFFLAKVGVGKLGIKCSGENIEGSKKVTINFIVIKG